MNEEAQKLLTKAKINTLLNNPFFGFLCLHLEVIEDCSVPTMCTNGDFLRYNPDFVIRLAKDYSQKGIEAALLHELEHICWGHIWRRGDRDFHRWAIAADAVVNADLIRLGYRVPDNWVRIEGVDNMSVEEVYRLIKVRRVAIVNTEQDKNASGQSRDDAYDETLKWEVRGKTSSGNVVQSHKLWGKNKDNKPMNSHEKAEAETKWKTRISQARQLARQQGQGLGQLEQVIDELLEPKIHWRELLRDFIISSAKSDYRLTPPSRRYLHLGMYLPSIYGDEVEIAFAVDTSASMTDKEVIEGFSEAQAICSQFANHIIHWYQADWGIQEYKVIDVYEPDIPRKIRGRGGTSFIPVFEDIQERKLNISCLIYFTDLQGSFPESSPPYPVLWLTTSNETAPFGITIPYEPNQNGR